MTGWTDYTLNPCSMRLSLLKDHMNSMSKMLGQPDIGLRQREGCGFTNNLVEHSMFSRSSKARLDVGDSTTEAAQT